MQPETKEYVLKLCSQIGAEPNDSLWNIIGSEENKKEVNKIFFNWYEQAAIGMSNQVKEFLSSIKDESMHANIRSAEAGIRDAMNRINRLTNDISNYAANIERFNRDIDKYKREQGTDFSKAIEEVLALKWYRLDEAKTLTSEQDAATRNQKCVYFITPPVTCKGFDDQNGAMNEAYLGQFHVRYRPSDGAITVHKYQDNAWTHNEFYHPHVTTDGAICWGNASTALSEAIKTRRPALALDALRILLQTYNSESPYRRLMDFKRANESVNRVKREPIDASKVEEYGRIYFTEEYYDDLVEANQINEILYSEYYECDEGQYESAHYVLPLFKFETASGQRMLLLRGTKQHGGNEFIPVDTDNEGCLDWERN